MAVKGMRIAFVTLVLLATAACTSAPDSLEESATAEGHQSDAIQFDSMAEWGDAMVSCLHDEGWPSARTPDGGLSIEVPDLTVDQREAFMAASDKCDAAVGPAPNSAPLSADDIRELYAHLVGSIDCIEALGFHVTSQPPSEGVFVDDYLSGEAPWSPFNDVVAEATGEEWDRLNEVCPQWP